MGLDMWTILAKKRHENTKATYEDREKFTADWNIEDDEHHYWRKNRHLNNWMAQRYYNLGGTSDDFNCCYLVLTVNILKELQCDIENSTVEQMDEHGFFWGEGDYTYKETDLKFCKDAIAELEELGDDYAIVYTNWW